MAGSSHATLLTPASDCRSCPDFAIAGRLPGHTYGRFTHEAKSVRATVAIHALSSSRSFKLPPNFVRQLSNKARRNCSNSGVAQVVAATWSDNSPPSHSATAAAASLEGGVEGLDHSRTSVLSGDGSLAVHGGERFGRVKVDDTVTMAVANTSAHFFKNTTDLLDYKENRTTHFEYMCYGNPTTAVVEEKMSALEGAEASLVGASGMCACAMTLLALVPAGGHVVMTTDSYRRTRAFIQTILPKMGITATTIDPADMNALEVALKENNVTLFFTESPTNPFLRCVDIKLVSELCHRHGALVCIDGTFGTPLNQKVLSLGADLVIHSLTKYIGGHNDVMAGCVSGSMKLVSEIRKLHDMVGGILNPDAGYLVIRGMKTLHLRVEHQNSSGLKMAKLLEAHPKIKRVYYPGLPSHPEHNLAKRQMTGFGGVVSFEVDGDMTTTRKFIDSVKIPYIAPSFGGCESFIEPMAAVYWDVSPTERLKYGMTDNLVRFSAGIEDFEDSKADILQALDAI